MLDGPLGTPFRPALGRVYPRCRYRQRGWSASARGKSQKGYVYELRTVNMKSGGAVLLLPSAAYLFSTYVLSLHACGAPPDRSQHHFVGPPVPQPLHGACSSARHGLTLLQSLPPTSLYAAAALTATQSTKRRIQTDSTALPSPRSLHVKIGFLAFSAFVSLLSSRQSSERARNFIFDRPPGAKLKLSVFQSEEREQSRCDGRREHQVVRMSVEGTG